MLGTGGLYSQSTKLTTLHYHNSVFLREGRKGSLAKFGRSVGFAGFDNVPYSEGMADFSLFS